MTIVAARAAARWAVTAVAPGRTARSSSAESTPVRIPARRTFGPRPRRLNWFRQSLHLSRNHDDLPDGSHADALASNFCFTT
jgi:hypothetical protein